MSDDGRRRSASRHTPRRRARPPARPEAARGAASGGAAARTRRLAASSSTSVHQRCSPSPRPESPRARAPDGSRMPGSGRGSSAAPSGRPTCSSGTCVRTQTHLRGGATSSRPSSSRSSRARAAASSSPSSAPAPGGRPDGHIWIVEAEERDPVIGVEDECPDTGSEPHATSERSARNHVRRTSHGTAAFAGEVDGRTKSSVSLRRASWRPCCGRPPKGPR